MKYVLKKKSHMDGMALLTVFSVLVILLILSLAIVSLSTGNLATVGNINSRLQALNLANSAIMYAVYEIETTRSAGSSWSPGNIPSAPTGLSFLNNNYSPIVNTNGLPGTCRVAYIDNLNNPNNVTVSGGPSFYALLPDTEVPGEAAVIIGQGEYNGYKRTVKSIVKYADYGGASDGIITLENGNFIANGISEINTLSPGPGSLYSKGGINYSDILSYKFYNGSTLMSSGLITKTGGGSDINNRFLLPNQPEISLPDWDMSNPNITGDLTLYNNTAYPTEPSNLNVNSILRPSFSTLTPDIDDDERYVYTCNLAPLVFNNQNIFIDGSLHIATGGYNGDLGIYDSNLFVNGVLIIDGCINGYNSNIFVSGYVNDSSPPDPEQPFGSSMFVKGQDQYIDPDYETGVNIFSDGDVKFNNDLPNYGANIDQWILSAPSDPMT